jgi:hypothetical protein
MAGQFNRNGTDTRVVVKREILKSLSSLASPNKDADKNVGDQLVS